MEKRYKIILSNKYLFKEAELPENANGIKVGTGINCDIRLRKDMFFEQFELIFVKNNTNGQLHVLIMSILLPVTSESLLRKN